MISKHGSSLRPLCPTRWTVKHKSLESVERNYAPLLETLEDISTGSDSGISCYEVRSKAAGIYHSMQTFNTFFGVMLGVKFYGITDILNCTLQGRHITAFDAKGAARAVCQTLLDLRSDTSFITFYILGRHNYKSTAAKPICTCTTPHSQTSEKNRLWFKAYIFFFSNRLLSKSVLRFY